MRLIDKIPPMLTDEGLIKTLEKYPTYHNPHSLSKSDRLIYVQDIFDVYVPNAMSIELYNSIYFLLLQACKRKEQGLGFHSMNNESILICGDAGIGKSETIARINEVMFCNHIIELDNPYNKVIPILIVQCSIIQSFKGFLKSILFEIDKTIGTNYGLYADKNTINTDELLIATSKAISLHVLCIVVEEMNFINESNKAISYANQIVALSNMINASIIFVCVPLGLNFFMSSDYLARRALAKVYKGLEFEECEELIYKLLEYNYTLKEPSINQELVRTIYNSVNGIPALVKQVVVASQVWAINSGYEKIDTYSIKKGIESKLTTMEPFINNSITINHQKVTSQKASLRTEIVMDGQLVNIFEKASKLACKDPKNAIKFLKEYLDIVEVTL